MKTSKLSTLAVAVTASLLGASFAVAQQPDPYGTLPPAPASDYCESLPTMPGWPTPNPLQFKDDDVTIVVTTATSLYPPGDARDALPTNLCQTVYAETRSRRMDGSPGPIIPNSLPSTPENPYNLHPDPIVTEIDIRSPTDDLRMVMRKIRQAVEAGQAPDADAVQMGIDILEGNPIDRAYTGLPMLNYTGAERVSTVTPEFNDPNDPNKVTGGNADVHQIWFDGRIMSDSMFVMPATTLDVPWTITYHVDTLRRGREDFAPFAMYFNGPVAGHPDVPKAPGIGIDATFFPMEDGTRTTFKIGMAPARQYKLTYHWGWRNHPPRIQALENGLAPELGVNLVDWERCVFGPAPSASEANKLAAIAMIGNLAPAKRMWNMLRNIRTTPGNAPGLINNLDQALFDWEHRNRMPTGVQRDDNFDVTLFYVNNTIYGDLKGYINEAQRITDSFNKRGDQTRIKVLNGDYFEKAHMIVDFGGARGWENIFQNTIPVLGAGPWFTFGRAYWWPTLEAPNGGPQPIPTAIPPAGVTAKTLADCQASHPAAQSETLKEARKLRAKYGLSPDMGDYAASMTPASVQKAIEERGAQAFVVPTREAMEAQGANGLGLRHFEINWNHEPNPRLRIYMFDQTHHDVAIWSVH